MAIKIAIANQKGGVGKTTTAINITDALEHCGYKTLIVDLDPQCNATSSYNIDTEGVASLFDVFNEKIDIKDAIINTEQGDILPGDALLPTIESQVNARMDRYTVLKKKLSQIEDGYDYILFDTPPTLGLWMINAITAADGCICPIAAQKYAIDGLGQLINTIKDAQENVNPKLVVYGVLLNNFNSLKKLDKDTWKELPLVGEELGFRVFSTPIRQCQEICNAQSLGISLFEYSPYSNAAIDYANVVKELFDIIEKGE